MAPAELLAALAVDPDDRARGGVAANSILDGLLLRQLAADTSQWVRANAAMNPTCPPNLLATLAADRDSELVRLASSGTMRRLDRARWKPT